MKSEAEDDLWDNSNPVGVLYKKIIKFGQWEWRTCEEADEERNLNFQIVNDFMEIYILL